MLNYPGINTWNTVEVQDTLLAVVKLDLPYNLLDVKFPYNITKDVIDKLLNKNVDNAPPVMMYS